MLEGVFWKFRGKVFAIFRIACFEGTHWLFVIMEFRISGVFPGMGSTESGKGVGGCSDLCGVFVGFDFGDLR